MCETRVNCLIATEFLTPNIEAAFGLVHACFVVVFLAVSGRHEMSQLNGATKLWILDSLAKDILRCNHGQSGKVTETLL